MGSKKEEGGRVSTLRAAFNCSSSSRWCDVELWTDGRRSISLKDEGCQVLKGKVGSCFFALEGFACDATGDPKNKTEKGIQSQDYFRGIKEGLWTLKEWLDLRWIGCVKESKSSAWCMGINWKGRVGRHRRVILVEK